MALSLQGKTAIVTGAGSGINLCFAEILLGRGCNVLFADLNLRDEAKELISNYDDGNQSRRRAIFQQTDVRDWQQLERMFNTATKHFGEIDIVCPGAGVYEPPFSSFWHPPGTGPSQDSPTSSRYASLDILLTHPIRTTQLAIAHFLSSHPQTTDRPPTPRPPKSIIHISSIAGQVTPFHAPLYNAAKHGINGFVRSLGPLEETFGIRVTAVAPGVIKTPLWTEDPEKLRMFTEGDEWVTPEFVAETMVSLVERERVEVAVSGPGSGGGTTGGGDRVDMGDFSAGELRGETKLVDVHGGMILEVAKGKIRVVEQFNDPGPSGEGNTLGNKQVAYDEIFDSLGGGKWGVCA